MSSQVQSVQLPDNSFPASRVCTGMSSVLSSETVPTVEFAHLVSHSTGFMTIPAIPIYPVSLGSLLAHISRQPAVREVFLCVH